MAFKPGFKSLCVVLAVAGMSGQAHADCGGRVAGAVIALNARSIDEQLPAAEIANDWLSEQGLV